MAAGIPVYDVKIDASDLSPKGVDRISLVTFPAIESNFIQLADASALQSVSKEELIALHTLRLQSHKLAAVSDNAEGTGKSMVMGPLLIPDFEILRLDENGEPYFIRFSKEVIEEISVKFARNLMHRNTNEQHSVPLAGNTLVQSWIVLDSEKDASAVKGLSLPVGTWCGVMDIADHQYFQDQIVSGNLRGFSIEGWFDFELSKVKNSTQLQDSTKVTKPTNRASFHKVNSSDMSKNNGKIGLAHKIVQAVADFFKEPESKTELASHTLEDGTTKILVVDETQQVWYLTEDNLQGDAVPDGEYVLEDGSTLVVADQKQSELRPAEDASTTPATMDEAIDAAASELNIEPAALKAALKAVTIDCKLASDVIGKGAKLCKAEDKTSLSILIEPESQKPMYVDQNSGRICYVEDHGGYLWAGDYVPAGTYTLASGETVVVVEKTEVYAEGTDWEWQWTDSYVDYEASTVAPEVLVPWLSKAMSEIAELSKDSATKLAKATTNAEGLKAENANLQKEVADLKAKVTELQKQPAAAPTTTPKASGAVNAKAEEGINVDPEKVTGLMANIDLARKLRDGK